MTLEELLKEEAARAGLSWEKHSKTEIALVAVA